MPTKKETDGLYMNIALGYARLSKAKRKQVGACLVTNTGVVLGGANGTAAGTDNTCEDLIDGELVTRKNVIHSELNAVLKAAKEGISCVDSTIYVSLSPCEHCSAMLINAGVKRVLYLEEYRDLSGILLLQSANVQVEKYVP